MSVTNYPLEDAKWDEDIENQMKEAEKLLIRRPKMTEDTEKALKIMEPLAKELGISMEADGGLLYIDGQAIGISANSTWATLMEIIGWIFLEKYMKEFRGIDMDYMEIKEGIKRYWVSKPLLRKIIGE